MRDEKLFAEENDSLMLHNVAGSAVWTFTVPAGGCGHGGGHREFGETI